MVLPGLLGNRKTSSDDQVSEGGQEESGGSARDNANTTPSSTPAPRIVINIDVGTESQSVANTLNSCLAQQTYDKETQVPETEHKQVGTAVSGATLTSMFEVDAGFSGASLPSCTATASFDDVPGRWTSHKGVQIVGLMGTREENASQNSSSGSEPDLKTQEEVEMDAEFESDWDDEETKLLQKEVRAEDKAWSRDTFNMTSSQNLKCLAKQVGAYSMVIVAFGIPKLVVGVSQQYECPAFPMLPVFLMATGVTDILCPLLSFLVCICFLTEEFFTKDLFFLMLWITCVVLVPLGQIVGGPYVLYTYASGTNLTTPCHNQSLLLQLSFLENGDAQGRLVRRQQPSFQAIPTPSRTTLHTHSSNPLSLFNRTPRNISSMYPRHPRVVFSRPASPIPHEYPANLPVRSERLSRHISFLSSMLLPHRGSRQIHPRYPPQGPKSPHRVHFAPPRDLNEVFSLGGSPLSRHRRPGSLLSDQPLDRRRRAESRPSRHERMGENLVPGRQEERMVERTWSHGWFPRNGVVVEGDRVGLLGNREGRAMALLPLDCHYCSATLLSTALVTAVLELLLVTTPSLLWCFGLYAHRRRLLQEEMERSRHFRYLNSVYEDIQERKKAPQVTATQEEDVEDTARAISSKSGQ